MCIRDSIRSGCITQRQNQSLSLLLLQMQRGTGFKTANGPIRSGKIRYGSSRIACRCKWQKSNAHKMKQPYRGSMLAWSDSTRQWHRTGQIEQGRQLLCAPPLLRANVGGTDFSASNSAPTPSETLDTLLGHSCPLFAAPSIRRVLYHRYIRQYWIMFPHI